MFCEGSICCSFNFIACQFNDLFTCVNTAQSLLLILYKYSVCFPFLTTYLQCFIEKVLIAFSKYAPSNKKYIFQAKHFLTIPNTQATVTVLCLLFTVYTTILDTPPKPSNTIPLQLQLPSYHLIVFPPIRSFNFLTSRFNRPTLSNYFTQLLIVGVNNLNLRSCTKMKFLNCLHLYNVPPKLGALVCRQTMRKSSKLM